MPRVIFAGRAHSAPEWRRCCWPRCETLAEAGGPPLCEDHFAQVGMMWLKERTIWGTEYVAKERAARDAEREAFGARRRDRLEAQSVVYYVRIGDRVKIGHTINLKQRLSALRLDADAVLATEPGGRVREAERHRQFDAERVGKREDFNPSRRLLAHIDAIRVEHGDPVITTYVSGAESA